MDAMVTWAFRFSTPLLKLRHLFTSFACKLRRFGSMANDLIFLSTVEAMLDGRYKSTGTESGLMLKVYREITLTKGRHLRCRDYRKGDHVWYKGLKGLVHTVHRNGLVLQLGPSGPFEKVNLKHVRLMTDDETEACGF